jgi:hypothetical protein
MATNIDRFKGDLGRLIETGKKLQLAIEYDCYPEEFRKAIDAQLGKKADEYIKKLPSFKTTYQRWYSESIALLRQVLPDRLEDFVRHYEKPKPRKDITFENYRIEDYLQGLRVTRGWEKEKVVGPDAAIPHVTQQLAIVEAAAARFESTLFEVRQLVQADIFDSELESAEALNKYKFARAAGALSGVVLEGHLAQVCADHKLAIGKKNPGISDFNEKLKEADIITVPDWRFIQHLADIRNLCDHSRKPEPTVEQVADLITGVKKVIKTIF